MKRSHARKSTRGPTMGPAFPRQYQGPRSLILVRGFVSIRGPSRYAQIRLISSRFASDTRKGLGSMHLLQTPLLGLQEMRI